MAVNKLQVGLGCGGFVLGALIGLLIGSVAGFGIAGVLTSSRETQAYLLVLIVPAVAFVSGLTFAATAAWLAVRKGPALLLLAAPGWLLLLACVVLAFAWHRVGRPASVTVRNESTKPFHNLYLGNDFRRNQRVGELGPGETSSSFSIDLDEPSTFSGLEGRTDTPGEYVRHTLPRDEASGLPDGDYVWVVGEDDARLTYSFERAP